MTSEAESAILSLALFVRARNGGIAQLARACGSYPQCPRFKSRCRYQDPKDGTCRLLGLHFRGSGSRPLGQHGPLVKWLRHRPFTAVTRVRVSYGSPIWRRSSAGRALASHARGHRFEFCRLHQQKGHPKGCPFCFIRTMDALHYNISNWVYAAVQLRAKKLQKAGNKIPQLASKTIESMRKTARYGSGRKSSEKESGLYYAFVTKPVKRLTVGGWSCILCM